MLHLIHLPAYLAIALELWRRWREAQRHTIASHYDERGHCRDCCTPYPRSPQCVK